MNSVTMNTIDITLDSTSKWLDRKVKAIHDAAIDADTRGLVKTAQQAMQSSIVMKGISDQLRNDEEARLMIRRLAMDRQLSDKEGYEYL